MATCRSCSQELTVELDPESFDEASSSNVGHAIKAPDDLRLSCGCHFHWQCLLDESPQIALDLACPACQNSIVTSRSGPSATNRLLPQGSPQPYVLTRYHNEGGIQENLDILPLITEEAYLDANPAARPARAFMTMCGEGDIGGIMELLQDIEEQSEEGALTRSGILRFQDPLDEMKSGLHVALERSQQEAVWLLLWLASSMSTQTFPEQVVQVAETLSAGRETSEGVDIRSLTDELGRKPADIAANMGDTWTALLHAGVLQG